MKRLNICLEQQDVKTGQTWVKRVLCLSECHCYHPFVCSDLHAHTLEVLAKVMSKLDPNYFMFAGTLLGQVRNQDIIPWEKDLDVAIADTFHRNWVNFRPLFQRYGYIVFKDGDVDVLRVCEHEDRVHSRSGNLPPWEISDYRLKNYFPYVDMYRVVQKRPPSTMVHVMPFRQHTFELNDIYPVQPCFLRNYTMQCPQNGGNILRKLYGKEFMKPDH
jgi:hypothetical protein